MKQDGMMPESLESIFLRWLSAPHLRQVGKTNAERSVTDRLNFERALRCLAAGAAGEPTELSAAPASLLASVDEVVAQQVREGAVLLNAIKGRAVASDKTVRNLVACCRVIRDTQAAESGLVVVRKKSPRMMLKGRPKLRFRPAWPRSEWPQKLLEEMQGFAGWKTATRLAPNQMPGLRRKKCTPGSMNQIYKRLAPVVRYMMTELGMKEFGLSEMASLDLYANFMPWYLGEDADGGFRAAEYAGVALGTVAQFLVAMGRLDRTGPGGRDIWTEFYEMGTSARDDAAGADDASRWHSVEAWTPMAMREVAYKAWNVEAPRYFQGEGSKRQRQVFARRRSGLFFMIAAEAPVRSRNFQEMRWGKNLIRTKDGRWRVYFRGTELKVAMKNGQTNVYDVALMGEASALIERWRKVLQERFGSDFESMAPSVFASADQPGSPISHPAFHTAVEGLALEAYGHEFEPHDARRVVATHIAKKYGLRGLGEIEKRLGDTRAVILATYFRTEDDEVLNSYLAELDEAA